MRMVTAMADKKSPYCYTPSERKARLEDRLTGMPLPPNITNPTVNMEEALARLKDYIIENDKSVNPPWKDPNTEAVPLHTLCHSDYFRWCCEDCEVMDGLYQRLQKRCITHETASFFCTPPPTPAPPPPSPLPCDFYDLLPRSLSSPAAPDLLSMEITQRRKNGIAVRGHNGPEKKVSPKKPKLPIKNVNLRRAGVMAAQEPQPVTKRTTRTTLQNGKISKRLVSIDKKASGTSGTAPPVADQAVAADNKTEAAPAAVPTSTTVTPPAVKSKSTAQLADLSEIRKKKLLWATTEALKKNHPELGTIANPTFKLLRSKLYRLCTTQWNRVSQQEVSSSTDSSAPSTGTSAKMLALAITLLPQVVGRA